MLCSTNASPNITTYLYKSDEQTQALATFAVKCGFVYRYVYIEGEKHGTEINQGFPYVLGHYLNRCLMSKSEAKVHIALQRCATCFTLVTDAEHIWDKLSDLYDIIFKTEVNDILFRLAKEDAIKTLKKAYTFPELKAFYHLLEFSDAQKDFSFSKFTKDLQDITLNTFQQQLDELVRPLTPVLLLSGNLNLERVPPNLPLTSDIYLSEKVTFCGRATNPALQSDARKKVASATPLQMRCMHFAFSSQINMLERYLLIHILFASIDGSKGIIHADAFDASIMLYDDEIFPRGKELRNLLSKEFIETAKVTILRQIEFDKENASVDFYANWAHMAINGVELSQFIKAVFNSTEEYLINLFECADPMICEGIVTLKKE